MYNKGILGDIWWASIGNQISPNEKAVEDAFTEALKAFAAEPANNEKLDALTIAVTRWAECSFENGFAYAVMLFMECMSIYGDKKETAKAE